MVRALITKPLSYVYVASAVAVRSAYASGAPHSIGAISPLLDLLLLKLYSLGVAPLWASWHPFARRSAGFLCWGIPLRAGLACPQLGVWPQPGRYIGYMIWLLGGAMAVYYAGSLLRARGHSQVCILPQCALDKVPDQMVAGLLLRNVADLALRVLGKMPPCAAPSSAAVLVSRVL